MKIWNKLCDKVSRSKIRNDKESFFEKDIARDFLSSLNWSEYYDNLTEQYTFDDVHASSKWIPDFALFVEGKADPEILIELKRPRHKQRKKDIRQLATYMKLTDCQFGLYFGEKLELFYLDVVDGKRIPKSVLSVDFNENDNNGKSLIGLLRNDGYSTERMRNFCIDSLKLNAVCDEWATQDGEERVYRFILKESKLPDTFFHQLKANLQVSIAKSYCSPVVETEDKNETSKELTKEGTEAPAGERLFHEFKLEIKKSGISALMRYYPADSEYVILAKSTIAVKEAESCTKEAKEYREKLLHDETVATRDDNVFTLIKNVSFVKDTPSLAGHFCLGRSVNAQTEWKDSRGMSFKEVFSNGTAGQNATAAPEEDKKPIAENTSMAVRRVEKELSIKLRKEGKISYLDDKKNVGYVFRASKQTQQGEFEKFWFGYSKSKDLGDCKDVQCAFVCKDVDTIILFPERELRLYLDRMSMSKTPDGHPIHWHIVILRNKKGKMFLHLSNPVEDVDITSHLL